MRQDSALVEVRLTRLGVYGKASATSDFELLVSPSGGIPREVERRGAQWLQAHLDSTSTESAAVVRHESELWLLRATNESRTDRAGRPIAVLVLGMIASDVPSDADLVAILSSSFRSGRPAQADAREPEISIPVSPLEGGLDTGRFRRAVAAIAVGSAEFAVVPELREAEALLAALPAGTVDTVAILPRRIPPSIPAGRSVLVSTVPWVPPPMPAAVLDDCERLGIQALAGLAALCASPEFKGELVAVAVGSVPSLRTPATPEQLDWLLDTPAGRAAALAAAPASSIRAWLTSSRLVAADLDAVADRIDAADGPAVAKVLRGTRDAARRHIALFGRRVSGLGTLLSAGGTALLDWLEKGSGPLPAEAAGSLEELDQSGILPLLGLTDLARLRGGADSPPLLDRVAAALVELGLSPEVLQALLNGQHLLVAPAYGPAPSPDPAWLQLVSLRELQRASRWACPDGRWREWWCDCLRRHPEGRGLAPSDADAPPSEETLEWLRCEYEDRTLREADLLTRVAGWRARGLTSRQDLPSLLARFGVGSASIRRLLEAAPPEEGEVLEPAELAAFVRTGVALPTDVLQAVLAGWPPVLLRHADFSFDTVALLDRESAPPLAPPGCWASELAPVLARQLADPAFWSRWKDGIPQPLLDWLGAQVAGRAGTGLVESLKSAFGAKRRLEANELMIVGGALSPEAAAAQLAAWLPEWPRSGRAAVDVLVSLPALSMIGSWLREEIFCFDPRPWPRRFPPGVLLALLPLLHPVRGLIRAAFDRSAFGDRTDRSLREEIVLILARDGVVPLPAPSRDASVARPEWAIAISSVPGWEHWGSAVVGEGKEGSE